MTVDKEIFGVLSAALALLSNGAYLVSVLRKKTKPHVFSWSIWGVITAIAFFAQVSAGAGAGAWHIAVNSLCCFSIAALAMFYGQHDIKRSDIIALLFALSSVPLWLVTHDPLAAVIVVILVETFAYYPTFRKSFTKPHEEMAFAYAIDALRAMLSMIAIQTYSLTTILTPVYAAAINIALVAMLLWRRQACSTGPRPTSAFCPPLH